MQRVLAILQKKPAVFVLASVVYLGLTALLKWKLQFSLDFVWYLLGGAIGIYFLDIAEVFFNLSPSPFRSIIFVALFSIVSFFVVTSSGSFLASGLVLSLSLTLLLWQIGEWSINKNLNSWYAAIAGPVTIQVQQAGLIVYLLIFGLQTLLFLR